MSKASSCTLNIKESFIGSTLILVCCSIVYEILWVNTYIVPIHYLDYEQTESYRITELMINHRDRMVRELLSGL